MRLAERVFERKRSSVSIAASLVVLIVHPGTAGCLSFHSMAQCVVHALKGLACCARPSCAR